MLVYHDKARPTPAPSTSYASSGAKNLASLNAEPGGEPSPRLCGILECADPGFGRQRPLSCPPDPANVGRNVRDRDQQRWRRCLGSKPLAPTIPNNSRERSRHGVAKPWAVASAVRWNRIA